MRRLLAVLILTLFPALAVAGPWPRSPGEIYVFTGHQGGSDGWTGLYAEYGLGRGLTFGLDAGGHVTGLPYYLATGYTVRQTDGRLRAFLRAPLSLPTTAPAWTEPWRFAGEIGIGRDFLDEGGHINRLGFGTSVGRGFSTPLGDGWITLDLRAAFAEDAATRTNLGAVVGLKPDPGIAIELAAFGEHQDRFDWQAGPTLQLSAGRVGDLRIGVVGGTLDAAEVTIGWALTF